MLLATMAMLRQVERPWVTTADVVRIFREAQRIAR